MDDGGEDFDLGKLVTAMEASVAVHPHHTVTLILQPAVAAIIAATLRQGMTAQAASARVLN
jgi:hypothetical protein